MKKTWLIITALFITIQLLSQDIVQWRGKNRDGKYHEKGLMKKWPENGPKLLWHFDEIGEGHSSAVVTDEIVYITGLKDGKGIIYALNHQGELQWKKTYGPEWAESYEGTRSTPLLAHGKLYVLSAKGVVYCLDAKNGEKIWSVDLFNKYDGTNIKWGITENLAINGNKLFCAPGGKGANVIALDAGDGSLIWKCAGNSEITAYCSPQIATHNGKKLLITHTADHILGIDAKNGDLLWKYKQPNKYSVNPNTPIYHNGHVFCMSGYGKGSVLLKISDDGKSVSKKWFNSTLDSRMGGAVLHEGKIYGAGDFNREWYCVDWKTGKTLQSKDIMKKKGNIIFADGMLYTYSERGYVGLVKPTENGFEKVSEFKVPYGSAQHWAHLVIHNKKLYVRHGNSLMVYDIAAK